MLDDKCTNISELLNILIGKKTKSFHNISFNIGYFWVWTWFNVMDMNRRWSLAVRVSLSRYN